MPVIFALLAAILITTACVGESSADAETVTIRKVVVSDPAGADIVPDFGALTLRGAYRLDSSMGEFGGLSGMILSPDGTSLTAISDQGRVFDLDLKRDGAGEIDSVSLRRHYQLSGPMGKALSGKTQTDAEEAASAYGGVLVSFERDHRVWLYGAGLDHDPVPAWTPDAIDLLPDNGGIEAMAALPGERVWLISEDGATDKGHLAWLGRPGDWRALFYRPAPEFSPTGATTLPGGDILVLERAFSMLAGVRARVVRVRAQDLVSDAIVEGTEIMRLSPPLLADNFESIATWQNGGETRVMILSDDNFNPVQQTLLFEFAFAE